MTYQPYEPIDPRDAFEVTAYPDSETTQDAAAAQAALLLAARAGVLGDDVAEVADEESLAGSTFQLPDLSPLERTKRMRMDEAAAPLGTSVQEIRQETSPETLQPEIARVARRLYDEPTTENAAALFEGSLASPHPLVRVAAAAGARETTRLRPQTRRILEEGVDSDHELASRVAQVALANIDRHDDVFDKYVIERPTSTERDRKSNTAVVTHGTFAANAAWYQPPNGDFYAALAARRPDLDVHDQSFTWTGAYSDRARRADALLLKQWVGDQGLVRPDFFAHSHGGTVANLATKQSVEFDRLVLMGWPVHGRWFPEFGNVNRIIDVRVRLDLVIMADRGGQRFRTNQFGIEEHRHGWFDHSSTHESGYWDNHGLWAVL